MGGSQTGQPRGRARVMARGGCIPTLRKEQLLGSRCSHANQHAHLARSSDMLRKARNMDTAKSPNF